MVAGSSPARGANPIRGSGSNPDPLIVLPATTFLEHGDFYTAGAHTYLQIGRAIVQPHGECRSHHDVICALAERLGARRPGWEMTAFEIIAHTLRVSGLPGSGAFDQRGWLDPSSITREGRPTALVRSEVLAELGLGDGDRMRIGNRRGSVVVHAGGFGGLQPRAVIVEGLWPNHAFEEGIGINLLTSADPGLPRGGAVFHDTSVWLSPA